MEVWDIYTRDRVRTGRTCLRGEPRKEGEYHLAVHVWIQNSEGKFLISRRSGNKKKFPHMYECVGGAVVAGEDSLEGALRESFEEVGVRLDPGMGKVVFSRVRDTEGGRAFYDILDVYLFRYDGEPDLASATTQEVESVSWRTREEIRELFEKGEFVPTLAYFFEKL